jgi:hypothetical protein
MRTPGMDVLLVGPHAKFGESLPDRLQQWGFRCQFTATARTAYQLICSQQLMWCWPQHACPMTAVSV